MPLSSTFLHAVFIRVYQARVRCQKTGWLKVIKLESQLLWTVFGRTGSRHKKGQLVHSGLWRQFLNRDFDCELRLIRLIRIHYVSFNIIEETEACEKKKTDHQRVLFYRYCFEMRRENQWKITYWKKYQHCEGRNPWWCTMWVSPCPVPWQMYQKRPSSVRLQLWGS